MLKRSLLAGFTLLFSIVLHAQDRYYTKTGKIEFFSKSPMEDIEARNKSVAAVLDSRSGAMHFSVMMKGFEFEKALMQEHFNENYVESDKYPKAEFKGSIVNNSEVQYSKDGTYPVKVAGTLTIHGVTQNVQTTGTLTVSGGKIGAVSSFNIKLSDYKIKIPSVVKDKVSNTIKITVDCKLEPLKT